MEQWTLWSTLVGVLFATLQLYYGVNGQSEGDQYVLEVQAHTYKNSGNRLFNGRCCTSCRSSCSNFFRFCLRIAGTTVSRGDLTSCPLGQLEFFVDSENDEITFNTDSSRIADDVNVTNPLVYRLQTLPDEGLQLLVIVYNDREGVNDPSDFTTNQLVDWFVIEAANILPSSSFSNPVIYNGNFQGSTVQLELSFRLRCGRNYYGDNCETLCIPQDNDSGHYACDESGNIVCLAGYTGTETNCVTACEPAQRSCGLADNSENTTTVTGTATISTSPTVSESSHITTATNSDTSHITTDSYSSKVSVESTPKSDITTGTIPNVTIANGQSTVQIVGGVIGTLVILIIALLVIITVVVVYTKQRSWKRNNLTRQNDASGRERELYVDTTFTHRETQRTDSAIRTDANTSNDTYIPEAEYSDTDNIELKPNIGYGVNRHLETQEDEPIYWNSSPAEPNCNYDYIRVHTPNSVLDLEYAAIA